MHVIFWPGGPAAQGRAPPDRSSPPRWASQRILRDRNPPYRADPPAPARAFAGRPDSGSAPPASGGCALCPDPAPCRPARPVRRHP